MRKVRLPIMIVMATSRGILVFRVSSAASPMVTVIIFVFVIVLGIDLQRNRDDAEDGQEADAEGTREGEGLFHGMIRSFSLVVG